MKKILPLAVFLFVVLAPQTFGQTDTMLDLRSYSSYFLNSVGTVSRNYRVAASSEDVARIGALGGDSDVIDTPLEIALLSNADGVIDIRPAEASQMLCTPRQADLKLGAAVFQEMQVLRFLGDTAAAGRHEAMLQFITGRGNVTRAQVEAFYRNGIRGLVSEAVDAEFNKISFLLRNVIGSTDNSFNAVLIRNQQNGNYTLRYTDAKNNTKELSAQTLEALSSAMSSSGEFSQEAINTVRNQTKLIPAAALSNNALNEVKNILTNFYTTPNATTYSAVVEMYRLFVTRSFTIGQNMQVFENARNSAGGILEHSNMDLARRIFSDARAQQNFTTLTTAQQQRLVQLR